MAENANDTLRQINQEIDKLKTLKDRAEAARLRGDTAQYKALLEELAEQSIAVESAIRIRFALTSGRLPNLATALVGILALAFALVSGFEPFVAAVSTIRKAIDRRV